MVIRKAVFPVAGLGTRFLPATKALPKEMLTVVDKPLIEYAVREAIEAGIKELIFVTSIYKRSIEDYFDKNFELETKLKEAEKFEFLKKVQSMLPDDVSCAYIRQTEALGLGHAVNCARSLIGNEPFAVLLADDLIESKKVGCLKEMVKAYEDNQCGIIAVQPIKPEETLSYGMVSLKEDNISIAHLVEKPKPEDAPSDLGIVGRYILPSEIFQYLKNQHQGKGGEIQLTDAIDKLSNDQRVIAHKFSGRRYDCGDKLGFLIANFEYTRKHPSFGKKFEDYVRKVLLNEVEVD
ncbi:UTP--glucose-1-phosphate uridylyltransferase GalU [Thiotrichales bacterium 19S9-12]|nr:UTP--glucose-1-phosphate uridylyltransferase GalU [Thiotrichales bacterium 19S9-11]MCF6811021.1 UTP--glucose-1-phosphate uridylyltransferase GalU [Thiotrichales bacterium 19S9-12]